jgi:hypothetical protein
LNLRKNRQADPLTESINNVAGLNYYDYPGNHEQNVVSVKETMDSPTDQRTRLAPDPVWQAPDQFLR